MKKPGSNKYIPGGIIVGPPIYSANFPIDCVAPLSKLKELLNTENSINPIDYVAPLSKLKKLSNTENSINFNMDASTLIKLIKKI